MSVSDAPSAASALGDRAADAAAAAGDDGVHAGERSQCASAVGIGHLARQLGGALRGCARAAPCPVRYCAGHGIAVVAERRGGVQRPVRIGEMRAAERAQIRAPRHDDAVHVIGLEIAPTAIVAMPTSLRMRSANGVWYMRP